MRQMMLTEILLNPSVVLSSDEKRLSRQAEKIWRLFCPNEDSHYVAVWTSELVAVAFQYNARLSEIRAWLIPYGLTIDVTGSNDRGNNKYQVVELEGSNYHKRLKRRGII